MIVFPPFFLSAAAHYFRIWTGQVPALSLDKYNIANSLLNTKLPYRENNTTSTSTFSR
jgi:hypothetical protein